MKIINREEASLVVWIDCGVKAVGVEGLIVARLWGHGMGRLTFERLPSY